MKIKTFIPETVTDRLVTVHLICDRGDYPAGSLILASTASSPDVGDLAIIDHRNQGIVFGYFIETPDGGPGPIVEPEIDDLACWRVVWVSRPVSGDLN
ncbi:MAG: hypothetical protein ACREEM_04605 [Blastocatellia bacterium]